MRSAGAALILAMTLVSASAPAQNAAPAHRGHPAAAAAPKPAAAPDPKKATPAARDPGVSLAERALIQFDLAWIGAYNGLITGEANDRTTAAIKAFQKDRRLKETGTLAPPERAQLAVLSKEKQDQVGWRMVDDRVTGAQIGLPSRQVPNTGPGKSGTRWSSAQGQIQVETFRIRGPGTTLADAFEQQKKEPHGRKIEVNLLRPDFFILSGMQGLKKFYVRAEVRDTEVRGMTVLYDHATEGIMDPVVVVMSSAFAPFSGSGIAALAGLPGKRKVEYGTGIVVSAAGHILSDHRLTDGCNVIEITGYGNAEEVAQDQAANLALLRTYGASDLAPIALTAEALKGPDLTLVGISDPQAQGGGAAVASVVARLAGNAILPAPPQGFDGAAALDAQGRLVGMVQLKDAVVANAGAAAAPASATVAPAETLRKFLAAQSVTPASGSTGVEAAKAAVVRVICVRK